MKILLIGSGGREHALASALSLSGAEILAAPGNPGILTIAGKADINPSDFPAVVEFCRGEKIDLVVVGPEQPLADGLSDVLANHGVPCFGPSKAAARLETSKDFAKNFMFRRGIPTARFASFSADEAEGATKFMREFPPPYVLKADGLAAGKGVIIAETLGEAEKALNEMFGGLFGQAGARVVIEEFMPGDEASIFAITDGKDYVTLAPAQDHKRAGEGDTGKNTGGMGAVAPVGIVTPEVLRQVEREIIEPTLRGMAEEGATYRGCLYIGLMIHNGCAKVVEFNCRFGDPETQPVTSLFKGDFAKLLYSAARGALDKSSVVSVAEGYACGVVLASGGYPDSFGKGYEILGLDEAGKFAKVFHAGTAEKDGKLVTSGGRVLCATGLGATLEEAVGQAYSAADSIRFEGAYMRRDIGQKALKY